MKSNSICVSIVSHQQGQLAEGLLQDLARLCRTDKTVSEIIITLNVPEDECFLRPFRQLPIRVLRNPRARGFGANHNSAFAASSADIFVVMNPDVRLSSFGFDAVIEFLNQPDVGAWAPCVVSRAGNVEDSARRFPTVLKLASRVFLNRRSGDYSYAGGPIRVEWAAGMFLAFRREVFVRVRGFDERYFMYLEDADICRRLGRLGLDVIYDPRRTVTHDARRASRSNAKYLGWHLRSIVRFVWRI